MKWKRSMVDIDAGKEVELFKLAFPTEEACEEYLFKAKYPDGFKCPRCGATQCWKQRTRRGYKCAGCRSFFQLTAGTIMHASHLSLSAWLYGLRIYSKYPTITISKFLEVMGLHRYETAFQMFKKIKYAVDNPTRSTCTKEDVPSSSAPLVWNVWNELV